MSLIETMMLVLAFLLCCLSSISDIRTSIISNRVLCVFCIIGLLLNTILYLTSKEFFRYYIINLGCMIVCSMAMYFLDMWAAGDSKLLIAIMLLIPGKVIAQYDILGSMPGMLIIIYSFSIAFAVVVAESIIITIKERKKPILHISASLVKNSIKYYLCGSMYMLAFNFLINLLFEAFFVNNVSLLVVSNLLFATLLFKIDLLFRKTSFVIGFIVFIITTFFQIRNGSMLLFIKSLLIMASLVLLSKFSEKYNYETIETEKVRSGMILSSVCVLNMQKSKIKGLPTGLSEDMDCRLTEDEACSVRRWKDSVYGKSTVTIVRKLPFALFISIGTLVFVLRGIIWIHDWPL